MIERIPDNSVRVKVTNECQWACNFCHNEGTELPSNKTKRVSVFLDENSNLSLPHPKNMTADAETFRRLLVLREIGIDEIHLIGGELTLNPELSEIVRGFVSNGFKVKLTTNGQAQPNMTRRLVEAGVSGITFSVLSFDADEFLSTQAIKSLPWANAMIKREKENILLAKTLGVEVKINTVVLGEFDHVRVDTVKEFAQEHRIKLILLPDLSQGEEASGAVFDYADKYGNLVGEIQYTNNGKGSKRYVLSDGMAMDAKYIRQYQPEVVCNGCEHKGEESCVESFYGIRLEFRCGEPYVRLCIQKTNDKTVMKLEDFTSRDLVDAL